MAGKKISGAYPDSLNFPDSIIPKTSKISEPIIIKLKCLIKKK